MGIKITSVRLFLKKPDGFLPKEEKRSFVARVEWDKIPKGGGSCLGSFTEKELLQLLPPQSVARLGHLDKKINAGESTDTQEFFFAPSELLSTAENFMLKNILGEKAG